MSNENIEKAFQNKKAFIPFITCSDPDIETTKALVKELEKSGASIIELGIPFSDPTAEGPVIQEANIRALKAGVTTDIVFDMVSELKNESDENSVKCPLVFMTYANVVFHYGIEKFCKNAACAGADGIILPDVPFEEKDEFASVCEKYDLAYISLIAPTSDERISMIAQQAHGFIYLVSSMGVTGVRKKIDTDIESIVARIREVTDVPIAIGFGIADEKTAQKMASYAEGVIVGSAIVKLVAEHKANSCEAVGQFAKRMVEAIA